MACAAQRVAGRLISADYVDFDARQTMTDSAPPPHNRLEWLVLEGLIAQASLASHKWLTRRALMRPSTIASRGAALLAASYADGWTIAKLARTLGTNRLSLTTEFRQRFGCGVHEYLVQLRVTAAQNRLLTSDDKIETIAHEVGFSSRKALYDAYERVTGMPLRGSRARRSSS